MKKEDIEKQAKKIMDDFLQALEGVESEEAFAVEREPNTRRSCICAPENEDFISRMIENAPKSDGRYIVAETKKW